MNAMFNLARERLLTAGVNWISGQWRAILLNDDYEFDATHTTFSDIPVSAIMSVGIVIPGRVAEDGFANSTPISFGELPGAARQVTAVLMYRGTDRLLLWYGDRGFGLPFTPDGTEVVITPDASFGGFFRV